MAVSVSSRGKNAHNLCMALAAGEDQQMDEVLTRLVAQYPSCDPSDIAYSVQSARECFASSTIRDFLPLLVERRVRKEMSTAPPFAP
jgi:hypothetical protein